MSVAIVSMIFLGVTVLLIVHSEREYARRRSCYTEDGEPVRCANCGGYDLRRRIQAIDGGVPSEILVDCRRCEAELGLYAYGHWDPDYREGLKW